MDNPTFDPATLFTKHAEAEAVKEANAYRTLPSGTYRLSTQKIEYRLGLPQSPWPGAELIHIQAKAQGVERTGTLFFDISYQTLRREDGRLDSPTRLWGQYEKALGVQGKNAGDVVEAITRYPVDAFVTESFQTPEGYRTPKTPADHAAYVNAGYEARNFVQNVRAARG